jgi:hypothetical protein
LAVVWGGVWWVFAVAEGRAPDWSFTSPRACSPPA